MRERTHAAHRQGGHDAVQGWALTTNPPPPVSHFILTRVFILDAVAFYTAVAVGVDVDVLSTFFFFALLCFFFRRRRGQRPVRASHSCTAAAATEEHTTRMKRSERLKDFYAVNIQSIILKFYFILSFRVFRSRNSTPRWTTNHVFTSHTPPRRAIILGPRGLTFSFSMSLPSLSLLCFPSPHTILHFSHPPTPGQQKKRGGSANSLLRTPTLLPFSLKSHRERRAKEQ